ncbi:MAG: GNAT family N-acetyltransferase [Clostridia bacterium]|nr:GNAT family N-acetyltransferase [Clostridia bacterium]
MLIRRAEPADSTTLSALACRMWEHDPQELAAEFDQLTTSPEAACFLAYCGDVPVGFAQCQLRHDYVEGTTTSPVGFLEGVYVDEAHQRRGIARCLIAECEDWARSMGCTEFASDCEIDNQASLAFHLAAGFQETGRTIWFAKKL